MEVTHCTNCGKESPENAKFCRYCGAELIVVQSAVTPKIKTPPIQKRINRYDERVKEWATSKTFKTIMIIGIIGGCCFAACAMIYFSSLVGLLKSLLSF